MASLNDTLTVGLILILLFGAVSLYLYTCIQQCEQKLNLVESILLDIKMSAEIREYPELALPKPSSNSHNSSNSHSSQIPSKAGVEVNESDLYKSALEEAHLDELASPLPTEVPEVAEAETVPEATASAASAASASGSASIAPTPNYESMTLVELKALAKQRSISGVSSMKRSQILEALRTSDKSSTASIGGGLSPFLDSVSNLDGEGLEGVELLASQ